MPTPYEPIPQEPMPLGRAIRSDFQRYRSEGVSLGVHVLFFCPGFWAGCIHRLLHRLQTRSHRRAYRLIVNQICHAVSQVSAMLTRIYLPSQCQIGPGLFIPHFGTVVVNGLARIGDNCTLHPGVTIGQAGRGERRGVPVLGDRVYVGVNAVIIGKISVGNDAAIGAGAVVTKSVPPRAVVAGNPARVISEEGSFDLICYPGMETDASRTASLAASDTRNQRRGAAAEESPMTHV